MAGNVEEFLRRAIQEKLGKRFEEVEVLSTDELQPIPAANVHEKVAQLVDATAETDQEALPTQPTAPQGEQAFPASR